MSPNKIWRLFEVEEYPDAVADNAMPQSAYYGYISHTFLNGVINYVDIFAVYLIPGKEITEELIEKVHEQSHTHLGTFGVQVVVLAETEKSFWVFWYDPDVSDCGIGRCNKEKMSQGRLERLFLLDTEPKPEPDMVKLPWKPKGWVSF